MITQHAENHLKVLARIEEVFQDRILERAERSHYHEISVMADHAKDLLKFLKEDEGLRFTYFIDLAGADYLKYPKAQAGRFAVFYTLLSPSLGIKIQIRALIPAASPCIATVSDVFAGANWTEREVWDLYGIEFIGHPQLKRILLPEDYEGHPLRKDYPLRGRGERGNFPVYHATPVE